MTKRISRYKPVKAMVGRQRVPSTATDSSASFERQVRQQMEAILQNYRGLINHITGPDGEAALFNALEPVFLESQRIVPVDTRRLKNSGYLETRRRRGKLEAMIGYGKGGSPNYAATVHERLDMKHTPPTQAKFLQQPLEERIDQVKADVVKYLKEASGT